MKRLVWPFLAALVVAAPARAEENGLSNFFTHLFGDQPPAPRPTEAQPSPRPSATVAQRKKKKPAPEKKREASAPAAPVASATPPPEASKFVYVLGDSLAISAADGLVEDFEEKPEIGVVDRARDASGLVRDDYFDWPKAVKELVEGKPAKDAKDKPPAKEKIDYVVVMLGINDMQPMRDGNVFVDVLSDRWKQLYAERVQAVAAPLAGAHIPVAWVGLPPMRNDKFNAEVIFLNQVLKENAEKAGATFVDIFDAFADQSGGFDAFGPNIEGQKVKLRSADGIHLTAAGGTKLAHFLDEEMLKALDETAAKPMAALPPDISKPADINDQIRRETTPPPVAALPSPVPTPEAIVPAPPPPKPEAGPILSLTARPASAGATLASVPSGTPSEAERRLRQGDPPPAAPGRADDFAR